MIDDLKLGLEAYQEINDNTTKRNKSSIEIIQEKHKQKIEKLENYNNDAKDKFRVIEKRSICSNLWFNGLVESENET